MNTLHINQTDDTPLVHFDTDTGKFEIKGNSIPENIYLFYDPIFEWLDKYKEEPNKNIEFIFQMRMISSASSKIFFQLLNKIDALKDNTDSCVRITWLYCIYDEEIREIGLDFKDSVNVPFEVVLTDSD
ncbi:MAG: nuclear pore complex subunit [Marinilabiliales bacterium]|nr:MAG: nuclear pore complex subunit [Marinilabiliales bacterium]